MSNINISLMSVSKTNITNKSEFEKVYIYIIN